MGDKSSELIVIKAEGGGDEGGDQEGRCPPLGASFQADASVVVKGRGREESAIDELTEGGGREGALRLAVGESGEMGEFVGSVCAQEEGGDGAGGKAWGGEDELRSFEVI